MSAILAALRKFQQAQRGFILPPGEILLQQGRTMLRMPRGCKATPQRYRPDIIFVPSPINAPDILDLALSGQQQDHALLGWLHDQGFSPALLDWGKVGKGHAHEDIEAMVREYLAPVLQSLDRPVHLVGYCLGGMIAMAAAVHVPVRSLTLMAAPWDFGGYDDERRASLARLWQRIEPACKAIGMVPIETIQEGFWRLSPASLIEKYLGFGRHPSGSDQERRFIAIEDWANGGEPLPFALGREIFEDFYAANKSAAGNWQVMGKTISLPNLDCPLLSIASETDQIVPLQASPRPSDPDGWTTLPQGHVGMVVSSRARENLWSILQNWFKAHSL